MLMKNSDLLTETPLLTTNFDSGSSFIAAYKAYASLLTDAPDVYHDFCGLTLLSLAVGRTPISMSPYSMFPNLWTILIGRSGLERKSSAINLALNVLPNDYETLPNDFTPEGLQESLSKASQGLISKEEIGGFLESIKKKDYMSGTADLLCHLYDCPSRYKRTLRSLRFELSNICFSILAATTPSRFVDTVKPSDFNSGFLSRFLIVYGRREFSLPRRSMDSTDSQRLEDCRALWKNIYSLFHETKNPSFEFDEQALELVNAWQTMREEEANVCTDPRDADLKGSIITRMSDYVIKLSALYEVDSVSKSIVSKLVESPILISSASVEKACSTIDNLLTLQTTNLLILLTADNISTRLVRLTNVAKTKADADGWVKHGTLLQHMNMTAYEFKLLLQTAYERELIETKQEGKATCYRPKLK
jgi:hypothetical protein